jgi:peptide deformylase
VAYDIRTYGDPVLTSVAEQVENIDGKVVRLSQAMLQAMYQAPGLGLAAPQIGVQKQIFVYDIDGTPITLINPRIIESRGEWVYDEGCLSIPGLHDSFNMNSTTSMVF